MIWKGDMVLNIWIYQGKGVDGVPGIGVGFQEPDGVPDERDCSHDVSKASNEPSPSSVDFRPTCGLAWTGCQSIPPAGVDWLSLSLFFPLGASLFCFRWKCSKAVVGRHRKADYPPYGRDFVNHQPTGRFCNGKLATDISGDEF